jgi:hypothetical protein
VRFGPGTCTTCGELPSNPFRQITDGKIIAGCISAAHDGALYGESLAWHVRKSAVKFRAEMRKREKREYGFVCQVIRAE